MNLRILHLPERLGLCNILQGQTSPIITEIQKILQARGLYDGPQHGELDSATSEALARFQQAERLPETGELSPLTFCRLQTAPTRQITPTDRIDRGYKAQRRTILITKSNRQLTLLDGNTTLRQYQVAIGKPHTPTPVGNYAVATKIPNPGGVLGTRWMGLNFDAYGIHGTNAPWLIGKMVSNGCIRMHNHNAEDLFNMVYLGTPVYIRD